MGSVAAAWKDGSSGDTRTGEAATGLGAGASPLLQGAHRRAGGRLSDSLHPGVVEAAEAFAVGAQRRLLAPLPAAGAARVKVVASVHTDLEVGAIVLCCLPRVPDTLAADMLYTTASISTQALVFNQPTLEPQADGTLVLMVRLASQQAI